MLTSSFPPEWVDWVIAETGRRGQRDRLFPPRLEDLKERTSEDPPRARLRSRWPAHADLIS
ncbi:transposase domain-containing protein [Saccharothrix sp. NRRL B-16348]|uniref:transposase domain-containing protein n=1 Tax=Saccharothrix sp. NRRL B-16348 TaxID=1415542 RepID=UPI001E2C76E5|nr:transposase domain-containing protein [Saccharothrix sp. NRRL B-16348]